MEISMNIFTHNAACDLLTEGICKEIHIHSCSHVSLSPYMIAFWWSASLIVSDEWQRGQKSLHAWGGPSSVDIFFICVVANETASIWCSCTLSIRLDYRSSIISHLYFVRPALSVSSILSKKKSVFFRSSPLPLFHMPAAAAQPLSLQLNRQFPLNLLKCTLHPPGPASKGQSIDPSPKPITAPAVTRNSLLLDELQCVQQKNAHIQAIDCVSWDGQKIHTRTYTKVY